MAGGRLKKVVGIVCALYLVGMVVLMFPSDEPGKAEAFETAPSVAKATTEATAEVSKPNVQASADPATQNMSSNASIEQPLGFLATSTAMLRGTANLQDLLNIFNSAEEPEVEEELDISAEMNGKTLKGIPKQKALRMFVLSGNANAETAKTKSAETGKTKVAEPQTKPSLDKKHESAIKQSVKDLAEAGYDCGFVFLDLKSGKGIARNAGELFYSASAFKAAFVLYVLQSEKSKDLSDRDRSNIESTILWSSNGAYDSLAQSRMGKAYNNWLDGYGIEFDNVIPYYANVSAKSMARIWADLFQYLQTDSKNAKWFGKLLAKTSRSFIRSNLKEENVTVRNKAGWISDREYSATTDCAYIDEEGHPYLMIVLTDQPDSDMSNRRAGKIVKALFAARKALE